MLLLWLWLLLLLFRKRTTNCCNSSSSRNCLRHRYSFIHSSSFNNPFIHLFNHPFTNSLVYWSIIRLFIYSLIDLFKKKYDWLVTILHIFTNFWRKPFSQLLNFILFKFRHKEFCTSLLLFKFFILFFYCSVQRGRWHNYSGFKFHPETHRGKFYSRDKIHSKGISCFPGVSFILGIRFIPKG